MFRVVGGTSLGCALESMLRGGWRQPVAIEDKWLQHPFTDSVAIGFLIGLALAPILPAVFFLVTLAVLFALDMPWIGYRA